jgi:hypothetical protein
VLSSVTNFSHQTHDTAKREAQPTPLEPTQGDIREKFPENEAILQHGKYNEEPEKTIWYVGLHTRVIDSTD